MLSRDELFSVLEYSDCDEVLVEINEIIYAAQDVMDTSEGIIIIVDPLEDERELRPNLDEDFE